MRTSSAPGGISNAIYAGLAKNCAITWKKPGRIFTANSTAGKLYRSGWQTRYPVKFVDRPPRCLSA
jgi:hypothetical protein